MYLKELEISVSDIVRSKILKDHDTILKMFKLIQLIKFGDVRLISSSSNRNIGKELSVLTKKSLVDILQTAQGRARFRLFRLNKELFRS